MLPWWPAASRLIIYLILVLTPVVTEALYNLDAKDQFPYNLGRLFAVTAFTVIFLQVALAARLKWIERPFGLNLTFPFHRRMGICAALLLLSHPILLIIGGGGLELALDGDWYIWVGKLTLVLLLVHVGISIWRQRLGLSFETWRRWHDILAPAIIILAFTHSWVASISESILFIKVQWAMFLAIALALLAYHRGYTPWRLRQAPYQVTGVSQEAGNVWTVSFAPPAGQPRFDFVPGQFQFVTFLDTPGLPAEEHHFTISSSPALAGSHTSTIKASGDFTSQMAKVKPGDPVAIEAPFGRFSHVFYPEEQDLVFIAGGIGITPLMSNLRHMRDTGTRRRVLLLYVNRGEADIVFKEELDHMAGKKAPQLEVVHVLTQPGSNWPGESGRLDREKLSRLCGARLNSSVFLLCCPPPMIRGLVASLKELGVPISRISYEYFSL